MFSFLRRQAGFTLIELTLVIIIATVLAMIAWNGQGEIRDRSRFNDAVERVRENLTNLHNQTSSTVNTNQINAGQNTDSIFFAYRAKFTPGSSVITVTPLSINEAGDMVTARTGEAFTYDIPWGVTFRDSVGSYSSGAKDIFFIRESQAGETLVFAPPISTDPDLVDMSGRTWFSYPSNYAFAASQFDLQFANEGGRIATIHMETPQGNVTRTFR